MWYHSPGAVFHAGSEKPACCALAGIGVLLMGVGFCVTGICAPLVPTARVFIPTAAGLASGIALLMAAVIRYNR